MSVPLGGRSKDHEKFTHLGDKNAYDWLDEFQLWLHRRHVQESLPKISASAAEDETAVSEAS